MRDKRLNLWGMNPDSLREMLSQQGIRGYRAGQILSWMYHQRVADFSQMTVLSKSLREELTQRYSLFLPLILEKQASVDGTVKFLLKLDDEMRIEMVLIPAPGKWTLCISSQVGCGRGCLYCATGKMGLKRNLTAAEIVGQVMRAVQEIPDGESLTNLVFMGMGEPMDNLDEVIAAIRILQHQDGLRFSPRRMTVSTCGVVPGILKLAQENLRVKLAVSLNSARNETRDQIMPVNRKWPLQELKNALKTWQKRSSFRVTLEYIMLSGINLHPYEIIALKHFTGDLSSKVNLIPFHEINQDGCKAPSRQEMEAFRRSMELDLNVAVTLRESRGADIAAACGQLAVMKKH